MFGFKYHPLFQILSNMQVTSISHTKSISKRNPILKHKLQKQKLNKRMDKKAETHHNALTIKEHGKAIKHYLKYYGKGITVKNALDHSKKVDIIRAKTQLRAFYIRSMAKEVFTFTVKASGLYDAVSHQVEIAWDMDKADLSKNSNEIFLNTPIKFQCSCGRYTYWYRYILTKAGACLGLQEHRFPSVTNKNLEGILCKHGVKVMQSIHSQGFQNVFSRYVENKKHDKKTRLSNKDKVRIAGASFKKQ